MTITVRPLTFDEQKSTPGAVFFVGWETPLPDGMRLAGCVHSTAASVARDLAAIGVQARETIAAYEEENIDGREIGEPLTLRELTNGWPVGETQLFTLEDHDAPKSVDGLTPWRQYRIVFDDVVYRDDDGQVITTLRGEMGLGGGDDGG